MRHQQWFKRLSMLGTIWPAQTLQNQTPPQGLQHQRRQAEQIDRLRPKGGQMN